MPHGDAHSAPATSTVARYSAHRKTVAHGERAAWMRTAVVESDDSMTETRQTVTAVVKFLFEWRGHSESLGLPTPHA